MRPLFPVFSIRSMRVRLAQVLRLLFILAAVLQPLKPGLAAIPPVQTPAERAAELIKLLTPEELVGQLFLVTFQGANPDSESQIYDLITNHFVGGVVLQASNDNISADSTLNGLFNLTRQLQQSRLDASLLNRNDPVSGSSFTPAYIPLWIGVSQEGGGYPYDQILSGMTQLPNPMALGATWNPELAAQVGSVLGEELSALGINLLLGPSLDVLENPQTRGQNDLGSRTFGGDPFWVGTMGSAYIRGVHQGSDGRVAVVPKHFPGHGGSDRLPEEEVATVNKYLDELKNFDMKPFFAVTTQAQDPQVVADGLLSAHIRYRGFQGRANARPISYDRQALGQLLEELKSWRESGGVMVSDNLGSQAIRGFYQLTNQSFDPVLVSLNALLAGNDLLYIADFSTASEEDSYTGAIRTIESFADKYREDWNFQQTVDRAVLRILTLKFRLYGEFDLATILPAAEGLQNVGSASSVTLTVAQQAATLISPDQADLEDMPDPPNLNDRIVFISDTRSSSQCSMCRSLPILDVNAMQEIVRRRYNRQVSLNNLVSYSLGDLESMLNASGTSEDIPDVERNLRRAHWVVFAMLNASNEEPSFSTLSRFLAERPDLLQQKRLIVFVFGAPYYLDATNITKLSAYYALYSPAPEFLEAAASLLFRELLPSGASPVSIPGVSYDITTALLPDPTRTIRLELDTPTQTITETITTTPQPQPTLRVGDVVSVRTSIIYDQNGHVVQDNTPVEFITNIGEPQIEPTTGGIARTSFLITSSGSLDIRARSELAQSNLLRFEVLLPTGETAVPTFTPQATATPSPTPTPTLKPPPEIASEPLPPQLPGVGDWVIAFLISIAIGFTAYRLAAIIGQVRWGVRSGFLALIGGLLAYSYLALHMPGSQSLLADSVSRGVLLATVLGAVAGLLLAWIWRTVGSTTNERTR